MTARRVQIQELTPVALDELAGRSVTGEERERWERSVAHASNRLKGDLRVRQAPLTVRRKASITEVVPNGVAGTIFLRNTEVEIAPKYAASPSSDWIADLFAIIERVRPARGHFARTSRLRAKPTSFVDHIAHQYGAALASALREEPVRQYRTRDESLPQLRGRLLLARQLRSSLSAPHLLECEVDYLDTDNPTNHLLHWAARRLLSMTISPRVRYFVSQQVAGLPAVSGALRLPVHLTTAVPPQYSHYAEAVDIAVRLARGQRAAPEGLGEGSGLCVDMERLFEAFVERSIAAALPLMPTRDVRVVPQDVKQFAQPLATTDRPYFTRPDNVIYAGKRPMLLVDAKYKRFSEADETGAGDRPVNSDLYQMAASLVSHGCRRGLLLYPRMVGTGAEDAATRWWSITLPTTGDLLVGAVSLDLNGLSRRGGVVALDGTLASVLQSALEKKP